MLYPAWNPNLVQLVTRTYNRALIVFQLIILPI